MATHFFGVAILSIGAATHFWALKPISLSGVYSTVTWAIVLIRSFFFRFCSKPSLSRDVKYSPTFLLVAPLVTTSPLRRPSFPPSFVTPHFIIEISQVTCRVHQSPLVLPAIVFLRYSSLCVPPANVIQTNYPFIRF